MAHKSIERHPRTARGRSRRWPWLVLAVVTAALIGGFVLRAAGDQSETTGGAAIDTAVPGFALPSTAGRPIALTDYRGRKLVVYFYEGST